MSGGQDQRCAIVRALANSPKIILADEPTGNLDSRSGEEVFALMREMNRESEESLPGVREVHDLHIWAMGTSQIALTAHLVMPGGHPDDAFLQETTQGLHDRFEIEHVTLQVTRALMGQSCEGLPVVSTTPLNV